MKPSVDIDITVSITPEQLERLKQVASCRSFDDVEELVHRAVADMISPAVKENERVEIRVRTHHLSY